MDNRLPNLYSLLAKQTSSFQISELAARFQVSTRTIYNDIDKLNELLKTVDATEIMIEKGHILYVNETPVDIEKILFKDSDFINSDKRVRKIRILESVLLLPDNFSSEDLLQRTLVSKNTLLNDLRSVRKELVKNEIVLETIPFKGYKVIGEEAKIRNLLVATLEQDPLLFESTGFEKEKASLAEIDRLIEEVNEMIGIQLSDQSFQKVKLHFWVTMKRLEVQKSIQLLEEKDIYNKEEQILLTRKEQVSKLFSLAISEEELLYLANKLSEASITKNQELMTDKWLTFNLIIEQFITAVDQDFSEIDFTIDQKLYEGLLNHLRPAYKRTLAKETIENPMYDYVLDNYYLLHSSICKHILLIEKELKVEFSDQEISFFTLFFAASLERKKFFVPKKTKIVIICNAGISTSEILKSKIKNTFQVEVVGTFGAREGIKWLSDHKVDLVVTTIPLELKSVPVVQVNPYLSDEDRESIHRFVKPIFHEVNVDHLLAIVKKYTDLNIQEAKSLSNELTTYLNLSQSREKKEYQPMLKEILTPELIDLNYSAKNRDEAVKRSGELLVNKGLATSAYIDGMIENVEVNGTYIVIAPGIAMPHARPEEGALDVGFSIVTLKEPVVFGHPKNDPVKIVIGLCAIDHQTHLKALAELVEILSSEENIECFINAKDKKEIMDIVEGGK
ncbi:transcription antiterminator [Enterococcus sp. 669A]|uniref:Transcription antiterminator n=1 Tax=Candidatus Enterococcus moelleringii TaxID=2815325 RepID=A0ABS3L840_9ENTE|nr:BglG family transcription antiterminator [Enterococcus sp. 669A]MBO1305780.1 transcription antiterminator [Enterococcus sp. 669A]